MKKIILIITILCICSTAIGTEEWIMSNPVVIDNDVSEWVMGQPYVLLEEAAPTAARKRPSVIMIMGD